MKAWQVSRYGEDRMALPCGGSALVLAYRRDAFENEGYDTTTWVYEGPKAPVGMNRMV